MTCEITKNKVLNKLSKSLNGLRSLMNPIRFAALQGINIAEEPIFGNILHGMQLSALQSLKKKSRIIIPDSGTLIGVVDEDGILEEGEIFVQLRRDSFRTDGAPGSLQAF